MRRVDTLERFDINGSSQWALVRGMKPDAPVLLLVQAGPGFPMIHEAAVHERQLGLEEHFRVVYWDQRGTGRSFSAADTGPIALADLVEDVRAMATALCARLHVSEVHVVGFSLGATLSLLACAEGDAAIASLVCVGPDVNLLESERFACAFAVREAERCGQSRALRQLRAMGDPPHDDPRRFMTRVRWAANFGGIHRGRTFNSLLWANLTRLWASPHYNIGGMVTALRAMEITQARLLPAMQGLDLLARELRVRIPVTIFQGRHDAVAPPAFASALGGKIGAPVVWFEESAHAPQEEEPARFRRELLRLVPRMEKPDAAHRLSTAAREAAA